VNKRVVITGVGQVTSLGDDIDEFWKNITEGKSGVSKITNFDPADFASKIASEVKDFDSSDYINKKMRKEWEDLQNLQ